MLRRLLLVVLLTIFPVAMLAEDPAHSTQPGDAAHGAEKAAHAEAHPYEAGAEGAGHAPQTYFGIPAWILKLVNMILFIGVLVYVLRGPVSKAMTARREQIRKDAEEATARRVKADQMASEIQARLTQIEQEVQSIHQRAQAEGERQKRELIAAAEAEAQKILTAARNEVDNRLKHARKELTEYAGQLASERAESILREQITENDQKRLFSESLGELGGTQ